MFRSDVLEAAAESAGVTVDEARQVVESLVKDLGHWITAPTAISATAGTARHPRLEDGSPELLNLTEASEVLGCSGTTVRAWIEAGTLRAIKTGHERFQVPRLAVLEFLDQERHI